MATMQDLFTSLGRAVEGAPVLALGASALWGVLSIVLSPCHLASLPLIVGFISGQGRVSTVRAAALATLFAVGILVTIATIGVITAGAGQMRGDVGRWGNYGVAALFFLVGLHLVGVIPMPWSGPGHVNLQRKGPLAAFLLGLVFGIALGPCTFAYLAPMLGVTFKLAKTAPVYGASLLLAYGVGHCSVIVLAGTFTEVVQRYLDWNEASKGVTVVKTVCGLLVMLGGLWLIYTAP
jgi:cytochrome c-type biogenesis protein